jgi:hypothetical protein
MRKLLFILFSIVCASIGSATVYAQTYNTESLKKNIKSVQINNYFKAPNYPVISLEEDEFVTLKFDDLSNKEETYTYKIIHCTAEWKNSNLSESEYLDGFYTGYISPKNTSTNTYFPYCHYELNFPNEDCKPLISGNYAILIYEDNNDLPILSACFSIVEPKVALNASATPLTVLSYKDTYQQVDIEVDYADYNISQPANELKILVRQNQRIDNQVILSDANYYEHKKVRFQNNKNLIFEAGNDYRSFDISSEYILSEQVESIEYFNPYFHATLYPDVFRKPKEYYYHPDVNGRYIVNLQNSWDSDSEADYYFTHFKLPVEEPFFNAQVYIIGEITGNKLSNEGLMKYNPQTKAYEKDLLLKQGGYNYLYAVVPYGFTSTALSKTNNTQIMGTVEGNAWETGNEYAIYVYHKPFGCRYDKLIAFSTTQ